MLLNKVNTFLFRCRNVQNLTRYVHYSEPLRAKALHPLESRALLRISGQETTAFLQGLITNDMRHFDDGALSIYAMFLNTKGRVLYETLIHKLKQSDAFLLECDIAVLSSLQKHLKIYKLRRKIAIDDVNKDLKLWALTTNETVDLSETNISVFKDPRLTELGYRIVSPVSTEPSALAKCIDGDTQICDNADSYKYLRYKLGVSEGIDDLPPGSCFPLEANCDFLHGVSFYKGCYIGQELTARVYHTGVIRKRLMPLKFCEHVQEPIEADSIISDSNNPKSNFGKLRSYVKDYGLGLVRIKEVMEANALTVGRHSVKVIKPSWWPIEAPKEKVNISKSD